MAKKAVATTKTLAMNEKNEHGVVLRERDMIIERWKGYFDKLLNEENPRSIFDDGVPNEELTQGISRDDVKVAISRMKNGKATGMDGYNGLAGKSIASITSSLPSIFYYRRRGKTAKQTNKQRV